VASITANIFGSAHQVGHENFVWWWSQETELVVRIGEQDAELEALRAREQQTEALHRTVVQGLQQELAALREWQRSLPLRPFANIAAPAAGDRRELHHCLGASKKCAVAERNLFKDRCVISPCAGGTAFGDS
jgi:transposase